MIDLREFSKLISNDNTNDAKNILSNLIGIGKSNEAWGCALANLYFSFSEDIRKTEAQKKIFAATIAKYFSIYKITNQNIEIFNEYVDLLKPSEKDFIKRYNQNWNWENKPKVVFKNTMEFSKFLVKDNGVKIFSMINEYEDQFQFFCTNKYKNLMDNFEKFHIWSLMIKVDYVKFTTLCEKYKFNKRDIIKKAFKEALVIKRMLKDDVIDLFFKDLDDVGKDSLNQYFFNDIKSDYGMISFLINIIVEKRYESGVKYLKFFEKEIKDYATQRCINGDIMKPDVLGKLLEEYCLGHTHSSWQVQRIDPVTKSDWFAFLNKFNLSEKLSDNLATNINKKSINKV